MPAPERYLVADIGATNARFSLASAAGLEGDPVVLATSEFRRMDDLLAAVRAQVGAAPVTAACLAIAGPVDLQGGRITNGGLAFDCAGAEASLGCPVALVNDFVALAASLPHLRRLQQLGGSEPLAGGVKAVLGPGSGLGMGLLVPAGAGWQVLPSEGGHADLAPGSPLELELLGVLQGQLGGHVSWESVLSGPGLVNLYRAVCAVWGTEPREASAEWIVTAGAPAEDPVCHQTLEVFCGLLGAAAGNLALTAFAFGGVYLGGGILPRIVEFVRDSPLRRRFEERGPMSERMRALPIYLIEDPAPGLIGALAWVRDGSGPSPAAD